MRLLRRAATLVAALRQGVDLVKPSLRELEHVVGGKRPGRCGLRGG